MEKGGVGVSAPGNKRRRADGGRNDWRTPPELFRLLDMEFRFTLDAAADDTNHLCERYITEAEDALRADVADHVVWCNPPYGDLSSWVTAFATWAIKGGCTVVALLPAATDTRWFEHVWQWAHEIRFLTPRVRFLRPDGSPGTSNTTGSLIAIYRPGVLWQYGEAVGPVITYAPRVMHVRWIGNVPTEKPQQLSLEEPS